MKHSLLVVAHPDDESIFFGGLLLSEPAKFRVICVTDGNGGGRGNERAVEFAQACNRLGVGSFEQWDFFDDPHARLDITKLQKQLQSVNINEFERVFTHGPLGEYGHQHHQDVCYAVYKTYSSQKKIFSPAYNVAADFAVVLTQEQFKTKQEVFWQIYEKEVERFLNFLPANPTEGYVSLSLPEVEAIYGWFTKQEKMNLEHVKIHRWLAPYIESGSLEKSVTSFLGGYLAGD